MCKTSVHTINYRSSAQELIAYSWYNGTSKHVVLHNVMEHAVIKHTHTHTHHQAECIDESYSGQVRSSGQAHDAILYLTSRTGFTTSVILKDPKCEHTIFCVSMWLLTMNKDCSPLQHSPIGFSNGDILCSVWGITVIFVYCSII